MRTWVGWLALGVAAVLGCGATSEAFYLDKGRNFDVRVRAYSQLGIMTENSARQGCGLVTGAPTASVAVPGRSAHVSARRSAPATWAQNRNFYNPEFDAKLTDYMKWSHDVSWLKWVAPDDLKFRFAWWGFYDGLYDYLNPVWARPCATRTSSSADSAAVAEPGGHASARRASRRPTTSSRSYIFNDQNKNPRKIYGSRNRINELYIDYTKGPVFVRVGRQAISWGESDTIALLDVSEPVRPDARRARLLPGRRRGAHPALDAPHHGQAGRQLEVPLERLRRRVHGARARSTPRCRSTRSRSACRPSIPTSRTRRPTSSSGRRRARGLNQDPVAAHTVVVDHLPENNWANTRWGVRLQGLLFRDYTVQAWFFRTFNQAPVPLLSSAAGVRAAGSQPRGRPETTLVDDRGFRTPICLDDNGNRIMKRNASGRSNCRDRGPHAGGPPVLVEGAGRHHRSIAGSSPSSASRAPGTARG